MLLSTHIVSLPQQAVEVALIWV